MNIAYFTTAQDLIEYKSFFIDRGVDNNSSNQVFHYNLINCLALKNKVTVFSLRRDKEKCNKFKTTTENNIEWKYFSTKKGALRNIYIQSKELKKEKCEIDIALVDTVNIRCLLFAKNYCKKRNIPLIGIITDNPYNISNQSNFLSKMILHTASYCNAFISLTEPLFNLFSNKNKPHILIRGITQELADKSKSPIESPYFFYAGTLLEKYGINDLINSFNSLKNPNIKLVIAGHLKRNSFEQLIKDNTNIIFLGNIDNQTILNYENHSIANINPRPFIEQIDKYSIPSKVIEYSSKNSIVISGKSSPLIKYFHDSILWVDETNTLSQRLSEVLNMDDSNRNTLISCMKDISKKHFSYEANSKIIETFLANFIQ